MTVQPSLFKKLDLTRWLRYWNIPYGFCDGYAIVYNFVDNKKKFNYINANGKELLDERVDYARNFKEGYANVVKYFNGKRKENIIDINGNYILKSWVDYIGDYSEGYAVIELDKKQNYIDKKGNLLYENRFDAYLSDAIRTYKSYDVGRFSRGRTVIKKDGKYNFVNEKGDFLLKNRANSIYFGFSEGYAIIVEDMKRESKFIDLSGNICYENVKHKFISKIPEIFNSKLSFIYFHYMPFEGGIAKISYKQGKKAINNYFNHSGDFIFDDEFLDKYEIISHNDSYFIIKNKEGLYNCVDLYCKLLSKERFVDIKFSFGMFKVCRKQGKKIRGRNLYKGSEWNILDKQGNFVFNERYNEIYYIKDNLFKVENKDGLVDIITTSGKSIFGWQDYIGTLSDENYFVLEDKNGKHLADKDGKVIHPELILNHIGQFRGGWAPVCIYDDNKDPARNFMNYNGEFLIN